MILLGSFCIFMAFHGAVARPSLRPFSLDLKLSRGIAGLVLTLAGFFVLVRWWSLWDQAFLPVPDHSEVLLAVLALVVGHLLADFAWLGYGLWRHGARPRTDLVIHHVFGLAIILYTVVVKAGWVAVGVALTSEMMPVTSGLSALGDALGRGSLRDVAARLRLWTLAAWRLPLWIFFLSVMAWNVARGTIPEDLVAVYPVAVAAVLIVIVMDLYWCTLCRRKLRSP